MIYFHYSCNSKDRSFFKFHSRMNSKERKVRGKVSGSELLKRSQVSVDSCNETLWKFSHIYCCFFAAFLMPKTMCFWKQIINLRSIQLNCDPNVRNHYLNFLMNLYIIDSLKLRILSNLSQIKQNWLVLHSWKICLYMELLRRCCRKWMFGFNVSLWCFSYIYLLFPVLLGIA